VSDLTLMDYIGTFVVIFGFFPWLGFELVETTSEIMGDIRQWWSP